MFTFNLFRKPAARPRKPTRTASRAALQAEPSLEGPIPGAYPSGERRQQPKARYAPYKRTAKTGSTRPLRKTTSLRRHNSGSTSQPQPKASLARKLRTADERLAYLKDLDKYVADATPQYEVSSEEAFLRREMEKLTTTGKIRAILRENDDITPDKEGLARIMEEHERVRKQLHDDGDAEAQERERTRLNEYKAKIVEEQRLNDLEKKQARHKMRAGAAPPLNFANSFTEDTIKKMGAEEGAALRQAQAAAAAEKRRQEFQQEFARKQRVYDSWRAKCAERQAEGERQARIRHAAQLEQERIKRWADNFEATARKLRENERRQRQQQRQQQQKQEQQHHQHEQRRKRQERAREEALKKEQQQQHDDATLAVFRHYETKWNMLKASGALPNNAMCSGEEFPWPIFFTDVAALSLALESMTSESIAAFIFHPAFNHISPMSKRERIRAELLKFHPDKFAARVAPKIQEDHRAQVQAYAAKVATLMTGLLEAST